MVLRTLAWAHWQRVLTFIEPGEMRSFGHTVFDELVRNPNTDQLWLVGYMDLGSKLDFFLRRRLKFFKKKVFKSTLEN